MRWTLILALTIAACGGGGSDSGICTPCSPSGECGAGLLCAAPGTWCTRSCTSDVDCGGDHCVSDNVGNGYCFPACDHSASRCTDYPAGVSCQSLHSKTNELVKVCSE